MPQFTTDELALAIKLTSVQGYGYGEAAEIMSRNGSAFVTAKEVREQIATRASHILPEIEIATEARFKSMMCGIAATPPGRRIEKSCPALINFVHGCEPGKSEETLCWDARKAGFDCNITDIRITAKRCGYKLYPHQNKPVTYYDAIVAETCLWPIGGDMACGKPREVGRYCGAHHCRSLGRTPT